MVQEFNIDGLCRLPKLARHVKIGSAWGRVPAGVVVHADDRTGGLSQRCAEDFSWMSQCRRSRPRRDLNSFQQSIFSVEAHDPEFFDLKAGNQWCKVGGNEVGAVHHRLSWCVRRHHAAGDFNQGGKLGCLRLADSLRPPVVGGNPAC